LDKDVTDDDILKGTEFTLYVESKDYKIFFIF